MICLSISNPFPTCAAFEPEQPPSKEIPSLKAFTKLDVLACSCNVLFKIACNLIARALLERMTERVSEEMSDRMSERMSDRMSEQKLEKECQKICQKECQKMRQKECHTICQTKCQKEWQTICQKECQTECQEICQKECQNCVTSTGTSHCFTVSPLKTSYFLSGVFGCGFFCVWLVCLFGLFVLSW